jgi:predicted nucleic acid-binding protein
MSLVYFDASAFVKLLAEEDGSELAAELWDGCDSALSSRLLIPRCGPRSPLPLATTTSVRRT